MNADGSYQTIDVPGSTKTLVLGINDNGTLVGEYVNGTGQHAFVANIVPEPISSILFVTGGTLLAGRTS